MVGFFSHPLVVACTATLAAVGVYGGFNYYTTKYQARKKLSNTTIHDSTSEPPTERDTMVRNKAAAAAENRWKELQKNREEAKQKLDELAEAEGEKVEDRKLNNPPRYQPDNAIMNSKITCWETAEVTVPGEVVKGRAMLDTGNAGCTLLSEKFAQQCGLIAKPGEQPGVFQQTLGMKTISGVVPGAKVDCALVKLNYAIGGYPLSVVAAVLPEKHVSGVSKPGWDLLVSCDDIKVLQSAGFRLEV
eukprot:TRINITY_DN64217_c0_g3_i1.p1 TRINITY_DN64217_c0_g3~~TRINITY_DN64217_c0_g3_i1.p1  ORF type:complete len:246 (+),score=39.30 TRINITY_DN64217_c0_g3_i1:33-770(+)